MTHSNTFRGLSAAVVAVALLVATTATNAEEQEKQSRGVTNVVLVHGAFVDGSIWSKVVPLLAANGLRVVAVQLPLTSQADDVATVKRAIALADGPLLLVGHSYGGAVMTEAGNDPKVAGLVYVAAFAPTEGQSSYDFLFSYPSPALLQLQHDEFGFVKLTSTGIREDFAEDLSASEQTALVDAQRQTAVAALSAPVSKPAWRNKPCWFVIAANDRVIPPALQAMFAKQMNATSITLSSGHAPMLSQPEPVASFIRSAARDVFSPRRPLTLAK